MNKVRSVPYYGGKWSHLGFVLPCIPKSGHFVDLFGGSAVVLLNREPSPVETYNDLDGRVVNFFRVCRVRAEELAAALRCTPYAREEWNAAAEPSSDPVEDARRFVVKSVQSMNAQHRGSGWRYCVSPAKGSARGMAMVCSAFQAIEDRIPLIQRRLRRVQIENRPALNVLAAFDNEDTVFYIDPPYPHESRSKWNGYVCEMSDDDHRALAEALREIKGRAVVSGYDCDLYAELYADWRLVRGTERKVQSSPVEGGSRRKSRAEVCWTNFDPGEARRDLFNP